MIFPLFKTWLKPWLGTMVGSSSKKSDYKDPSGFQPINGGAGEHTDRHRTTNNNTHPNSDGMTHNNDSEEQMSEDMKLQNIFARTSTPPNPTTHPNGIIISSQVEVTHEEVRPARGGQKSQPTSDKW